MKISKEELKHHLTNKTMSEIEFIIGDIKKPRKKRNIISGTLEVVLEAIRGTDFAERRKR